MALLLLIPLVFGWLAVRRLLKETDALAAAALALPLGVSMLLLGVNGVYRVSTLENAVLATLAALVGAAALIAFTTKAPPLERPGLKPATLAFLVLATLAIYLFTNSQQIRNPDDDYWIHTPLQGLMLHGSFPPTNPFFSDLPMNGHYGRNLALVTVGWITELDMPLVQVAMTDLMQVFTFLLLFTTFRRATGSELQAALGAGLMFFGINVGGRGGLMDTLQNNNALVHLDLALIVALVLRAWSGQAWAAVLGGLALGGYAIVYETHFGLVVLSVLSMTPFLLKDRKALALSLVLLAVAFPISVTQGGPLTEMFQRKVLGKTEVDENTLSKGMQNQAQVVKLRFPKEKLFQILLEHGEYQRVSLVYYIDPLFSRFYVPSKERGYRPIWTWDVLRIHWLPMLLAPLSLAALLRLRHKPGLLLWAFGFISFLVPAMADFGPIYESEYYRWQFAAGVGLAGALGLAAGAWFEDFWARHEGVAWTWSATPGELVLRFGPRGLACLGLAALVWLDTLGCSWFLRTRLEQVLAEGDPLRGAILLPDTRDWLKRHAVLDFSPADWEMARWLEERVQPGDRILSNFDEENNFSILYESTLSGLSGARSVGHALPLDDEAIGTTPYHMAPPARAFWTTLDPALLRGLGVNWLLLKVEPGSEDLSQRLPQGLALTHQTTDPTGRKRLLYRVDVPPLKAGAVAEAPSPLEVVAFDLPERMRNGRGYPARLTVRAAEAFRSQDGVLFYETVRRKTNKGTAPVERILQPLDLDLAKGETRTLDVVFVAPHEDGIYDVRFFAGDGQEVRPLGGAPLAVDMAFRPRLSALRLKSLEPVEPPRAGRLTRFRAVLENPGATPVNASDRLSASVASKRPDGSTVRTPGQSMMPLALDLPAGGAQEVEVMALLPEEAGSYRLDLGLAPAEGGLSVLEGPIVEVQP